MLRHGRPPGISTTTSIPSTAEGPARDTYGKEDNLNRLDKLNEKLKRGLEDRVSSSPDGKTVADNDGDNSSLAPAAGEADLSDGAIEAGGARVRADASTTLM